MIKADISFIKTFNFRAFRSIKPFLVSILDREKLIYVIVSFLLGRAALPGGFMPFGLPLYIAVLSKSRKIKAVAVFSMLAGILTTGNIGMFALTAGSIPVYSFLAFLCRKAGLPAAGRVNLPLQLLMVFTSSAVIGIIPVITGGFLLYDFLKAILQSIIIVAITPVLKNAVQFIADVRARYDRPDQTDQTGQNSQVIQTDQARHGERFIAASVVVIAALSVFSGIGIFGFQARNILYIMIILISGYSAGPGAGAAAGVTAGFMLSAPSEFIPDFSTGAYAFCGFLSGFMRKLGKGGSGLGFVLGNTFLTLAFTGSLEAIIYLKEIIVAIALFLCIPSRFLLPFIAEYPLKGRMAAFDGDAMIMDDAGAAVFGLREPARKMQDLSRLYKKLSGIFESLSAETPPPRKKEFWNLFNCINEKACSGCSLAKHCWEASFCSTYNVVMVMIDKLEKSGRIDRSDIPGFFAARCERIRDFTSAVNSSYEIFKAGVMREEKTSDNMRLVSRQFGWLSRIAEHAAGEIRSEGVRSAELERRIQAELDSRRIRYEAVYVFIDGEVGSNGCGGSNGRGGRGYRVVVEHRACGGNRPVCNGHVGSAISSCIGRRMERVEEACRDNTGQGFSGNAAADCFCRAVFTEEEPLKVLVGVSRTVKGNRQDNISGDSYAFYKTNGGRQVIAISDGMGSGREAAAQSGSALDLLQELMQSGFDLDSSTDLINTMLFMAGRNESFATLDVAVIDLFRGEVEFTKIGAAPTYIARKDGTVELIRSATLPAGIMPDIETELVHKFVSDGDAIILLSDGVMDALKDGKEDGDRVLYKLLEQSPLNNPQALADFIIGKAKENAAACGAPVQDDMTVVAARIWSRE